MNSLTGLSSGFCMSLSGMLTGSQMVQNSAKHRQVVKSPCFRLSNGALVQSKVVVEHFTAEWALLEEEEEEEGEGVKVQ